MRSPTGCTRSVPGGGGVHQCLVFDQIVAGASKRASSMDSVSNGVLESDALGISGSWTGSDAGQARVGAPTIAALAISIARRSGIPYSRI